MKPGITQKLKSCSHPLSSRPKPVMEALSLMASRSISFSGRSDEAMVQLRRAIALYPGNDQPYVDLAALCMDRDALPTGLKVLDAALTMIPGSSRLYAIRGAFHAQLGHEGRGASKISQSGSGRNRAEKRGDDRSRRLRGIHLPVTEIGCPTS